jgi:hypothetical protein
MEIRMAKPIEMELKMAITVQITASKMLFRRFKLIRMAHKLDNLKFTSKIDQQELIITVRKLSQSL